MICFFGILLRGNFKVLTEPVSLFEVELGKVGS